MKLFNAIAAASFAALSLAAQPSYAFWDGYRNEGAHRGRCMGQLKDALRDPNSLEIPWGGVEYAANEKAQIIKIKYRARNGFGGMSGGTYYCQFDRDRLVRTENA